MTLSLVTPLPKPDVEGMLEALDNLRSRILAGEFESIWLIAWTPDNGLITAERGKPKDRLVKIGVIECFKQDLVTCMATGEETEL